MKYCKKTLYHKLTFTHKLIFTHKLTKLNVTAKENIFDQKLRKLIRREEKLILCHKDIREFCLVIINAAYFLSSWTIKKYP